MSGASGYDVSLYATRQMRNPNHVGEHEESLRSFQWTGMAPSAHLAVVKAKLHLRIAMRVLEEMTDKSLDHERFCVDHVVEKRQLENIWPTIQFGEVVTEQIDRARPRKRRRIRKDDYDVRAVLESGLKCLLADSRTMPKKGAHVLSAAVSDGDAYEREAELSYAFLPHGKDDQVVQREIPAHVELLQIAAAVYRLADDTDDVDDRTEATVHVPENSTMAAALIADLKRNRAENGKLAARFLRAFDYAYEAGTFEEPTA